MFRVENADFIADKLANELLPNQEYREVLKNAEEAVRRLLAPGEVFSGRIVFDVDWTMLELTGRWYLCCIDNGDGMTKSELERYTTTLAVQGAGGTQSLHANQGMGLKISGPTRHKNGILIRSMKSGERTMVQVGWDGTEYGLIPVGGNDELVAVPPLEAFPPEILERGSGTVVTFLGSGDAHDTFLPPERPRGWLLKYLNTRFFRLSTGGIDVLVRVPSGGQEDWPRNLAEAAERMAGRGKSFNLTRVNGTAEIWDEAADRQGDGWRGTEPLAGDPAHGVPPARIHWWVLPTGPGTDVSSRTASGGSLAVLYDNELHDWRQSNQANPFFARLGVLFGKSRVAFVLEPVGVSVTSDFARAHVLVGNVPALESDAWLVWAEQFRSHLPDRIKQAMAEEQSRLQQEDPDRLRRIHNRLKDIMSLLRPRRFRRSSNGQLRAGGPEVTGAGTGQGRNASIGEGGVRSNPQKRGRGIGSVLSQLDMEQGEPASEVPPNFNLEPRWVSEEQSADFTIVNGNDEGLHDRAAALAGTDGRTADILLLNLDFRGFQAILATVNEWANPEGDDLKVSKIDEITKEWIEQKLIEAVQGLRQLENGRTWLTSHYDSAMSPVALTAAFMADRYHTLREIKRAVGAMRPPESVLQQLAS